MMIIDNLSTQAGYEWVPGVCKEIAERCKGNQQALDTELGKMVVDRLLDTIKPMTRPDTPEKVKKFRTLRPEDRLRWEKENPRWRQEDQTVANWITKASRADANNKSDIYWLKRWLSLDIGKERQEKIKNKLLEYSGIDREETERIRKITKQFDGRVVGVEKQTQEVLDGLG